MLEIMALKVLRSLANEIHEEGCFGLLMDETSDVEKTEQVSICWRIISKELEIQEHFIGFYETSAIDATSLYNIISDALFF
ncbi:hypothetical protein ANN_03232 [Periplaneta americana]|uniref:DUF4371 domain-containing protein n=1 Tax=Periplaneta americana TaxID=6978 RepID=A0ABQ8U2F3_PERAM|nr:hypothetical protein ANN_03232 [Periplaneta americana]